MYLLSHWAVKNFYIIFKKINILFTRYALLLMFTDRNYSWWVLPSSDGYFELSNL